MTVFEMLRTKNIDELAEWFDNHCMFDDAPWWNYWDENYCNKCSGEEVYVQEFNKKMECTWCELHDGKCKFFPEMNEIPDSKQIIKMWLMSEVKVNY